MKNTRIQFNISFVLLLVVCASAKHLVSNADDAGTEEALRSGDDTAPEPKEDVDEVLLRILKDEAALNGLEEDLRLHEGDIALTEQQQRALMVRKAVPDTNHRWPDYTTGNVIVPYRFNDSVINQPGTLKAIKHWEEHTCIRFEEVDESYQGNHIIFVDARYCASFVGRVPHFSNGQSIWLAKQCILQLGPAVHEIGHAMGFNHEHSRSDRDNYVTIHTENAISGSERNFNKRVTNNFGIEYDFNSVMHYGARYFTKAGGDTITSKNVFAQPLIGNRRGLSFMDKKMANKMYNCNKKWLQECGFSIDPCKNLGYLNSTCTCICPPGTTGTQCQNLHRSYTDALIQKKSPNSEVITKEGIVSTPGYPTPIQKGTIFSKVVVGPECHRVRLVIEDFDVYKRWKGRCRADYLEIRTSGDQYEAHKYCGREITSGTEFVSERSMLVLMYKNYPYVNAANYVSRFRGFKGVISFDPIPDCVPTGTTTAAPIHPMPVTMVNSGDDVTLTLDKEQSACILSSNNQYSSPNYPAPYQQGDECNSRLQTAEPRYLQMMVTYVHIHDLDTLVVTSLLNKTYRLTREDTGFNITLLSSSANIAFIATASRPGFGFVLGFQVRNSDCHQIIKLQVGAMGTIAQTTYPPETICEYWIQAPPGHSVKLSFVKLSVGSSSCSDDSVLVDPEGGHSYDSSNSVRLCGQYKSYTVTSVGGQLNLLLDGRQAVHNSGFVASYSVV